MKQATIISAFPACGKTYYYNHADENIVVLDSDSSKFSWKEIVDEKYKMHNWGKTNYKEKKIRVRNPDFPNNYIQHIKENLYSADYILVSSHAAVRQALRDNGLPYIVVYPSRSLKEEWVGRCCIRGNDMAFCQTISENWDGWIDEMEAEGRGYVLQHGQHLSDVLPLYKV